MNEIANTTLCETAPDTRGHYMRTFTGREFYPMDPRAEDMNIIDIAHHLSMQCRFNGATKGFYSVAEHCVIGSYLVPQKDAFEFLMHDAAEAWLGDLIRPMKNHSVLGDEYKRIEAAVEAQVKICFGLADVTPPSVKKVDLAMCVIELAQGFETPRRGLTDLEALDISHVPPLQFLPWHKAKAWFMQRYEELVYLRSTGAL